MSTKQKMSLKEALGILAAPRNVQLAFQKADQIKGYPVKAIETSVLAEHLITTMTWANTKLDELKKDTEQRDKLVAEMQHYVELKESVNKSLKAADDLILRSWNNCTKADVYKAREMYFQAGYTDSIAFFYEHASSELTKSHAAVESKKHAIQAVLEAIERLESPDVINLKYYRIDESGAVVPKNLSVFCPVCGTKQTIAGGLQEFTCCHCGKAVAYATVPGVLSRKSNS